LIDETDVPRFTRLGVIASVQPCHLLYDIEALHRGLPHRLDRVLPLRELIDAGLEPGRGLIFGSDVPIVRADPKDSIRAATHRRSEAHTPEQAVGLGQRLTEAQAWDCFEP
jgi:predicted amidohydrolase YtcJ